jgi:hypothetical protein
MSHFQVMASSKEELWEHIQQLYAQNQTLTEAVAMQTAQVDAANAHCTIAQRENQDWRVKAENERRKKTRTSTKVKARYVTAPEFKESFEAGADARKEKERLEKDKKDKKKLDEEARIARIHNSIATRTFDSPFTSYKRKEDLEALAGALGLSRDGKIVDLAARIKSHLEDPDTRTALADNPRFSALYDSNDALTNLLPLPLPTQLRMKTQHLQQVLLSPRQPTIRSTRRSHHFSTNARISPHFLSKPPTSVGPAAVLSKAAPVISLHHHSHCCLMVSLFITPATRNTYSTRLLHTIATSTLVYIFLVVPSNAF